MNDLRKKLGIDDWLEIIKEDRVCNGAYISIAQYMYLLEQENQKYKEVINKMKTNLDSSINAINKKLSNNKFRIENGKAIYPINDYCVIRLKGIRTKCKELLKILNEVEHD